MRVCNTFAIAVAASVWWASVAGAAPLGPGWMTMKEAMRLAKEAPPEDDQFGQAAPPAFSPAIGQPDDITTEIQELADGLENDVLNIYNYVWNFIDFEPYYGSLKGATLTLLERRGNDFDHAALMVALLRASGYSVQYKYGVMEVPFSSPNGFDLPHWFGTDGIPGLELLQQSAIPFDFGADWYLIDRVWIEVDIDGDLVMLDTAFKPRFVEHGEDLRPLMGYNRSSLLSSAGGTEGSGWVQSIDENSLYAALTDYTTSLADLMREGRWFDNLDDFLVNVGNQEGIFTALPNSHPLNLTVQQTWSAIPDHLQTRFQFQVGDVDLDLPMCSLHGRRLALAFDDTTGNAEFWLDDDLIAEETGATGTEVDMTVTIDHPYSGSLGDQAHTAAYQRDAVYALVYGFGGTGTGHHLKKRQQRLQAYLEQGLAPESREVRSETLNVLGVAWLKQSAQATDLSSRVGEMVNITHHRFLRVGQESGYYVDAPLNVISYVPRFNDADRGDATFLARGFISSAMEHAVIEQLQGGAAAVSTTRILKLANQYGDRVYLTDGNDYASVRAAVSNYPAEVLDDIQQAVDAGGFALMPGNGSVQLGSYKGHGYLKSQGLSLSMLIDGGYFGGYAAEEEEVKVYTVVEDLESDPKYYYDELENAPNPKSLDPIDLFTGAFLYDDAPLAVGGAEPLGLEFKRSYNSDRHAAPGVLGHGWQHHYERGLAVRTDTDVALGLGAAPQAAATLVGTTIAIDLLENATTAKEWLVASMVCGWLVDQMEGNAVSVQQGKSSVQYLKLPDGTYQPPPGVTTELIPTNGVFHLVERDETRHIYDADLRYASRSDADGNTLTVTYTPSDLVDRVTDAYGRRLDFTYDGSNRLTLVTETAGSLSRTASFGYNASNDLVSYTDPVGETWLYEYDSEHRMTRLKDPLDRVIAENDYSAAGRTVRQRSMGLHDHEWQYFYSPWRVVEETPLGKRKIHLYDNWGRIAYIEDNEGNVEQREYDARNNMIFQGSPGNRPQGIQYGPLNNVIRRYDGNLFQTNFSFSPDNLLTAIIDRVGAETAFAYDNERHLVELTDALDQSETYTYHPTGLLHTKTDKQERTTTYTYDAFGYPDVTTFPDGSTTDADYNARGHLTRLRNENGEIFQFTNDALGRLTGTVDPVGRTTSNIYDAAGNIAVSIDTLGSTTTYHYDAIGNLVEVTLANGAKTTYSYDRDGWLDRVTGPTGRITNFTHDSKGDVVAVADDLGQESQATFDPDRNQLSFINANSNTWQFTYDKLNLMKTSVSPGGRTNLYTHTRNELLETVEEPSGDQVAYDYDLLGRRTTTTDGVGTVEYQYDAYNRPTNMTENGDSVSRSYDAKDRLVDYTDTSGNTIQYQYDPAGNMTLLTYPDGRTVTYTYDAANRMTEVRDWAGRRTFYDYDARGLPSRVRHANGTSREMSYDIVGRVTSLVERASDLSVISSVNITRNLEGLPTREKLEPSVPVISFDTAALTYDSDNRAVTFNGQSLQHDPDGNMTLGPVGSNLVTYTYDARNRLISAGGVTNEYDMEGRRTGMTEGGVTTSFVYSPLGRLDRLLRMDRDGVTTRFVYGRDGLLYEERGGVTRTYHRDLRGSTVALTDESEDVVARVWYDAYGSEMGRQGTPDTPFLFVGAAGVMTDPNGLIFMRNRHYHPTLGRFIQQDPIGFAGGNNLYAYAGGNPILFTDALGLRRDEVILVDENIFAEPAAGVEFEFIVKNPFTKEQIEYFSESYPVDASSEFSSDEIGILQREWENRPKNLRERLWRRAGEISSELTPTRGMKSDFNVQHPFVGGYGPGSVRG